MDKAGFVFVPAECEQGAACRVHIALHGCKQDLGDIGRRFHRRNRLQCLGRQQSADRAVSADHGEPIRAVQSPGVLGLVELRQPQRRLRDEIRCPDPHHQGDARCADGGRRPATPAPAGAPNPLKVLDTSDTSAALAWTSSATTAAYRVFRAGADGPFAAVADVTGPSFADSGLTRAPPIAGVSRRSRMAPKPGFQRRCCHHPGRAGTLRETRYVPDRSMRSPSALHHVAKAA
jgi:poly(3-hydroxybutyrate) depolymerase